MKAKFNALEQTHSVGSHVKFCLDRFVLSPSDGETPIVCLCGHWHLVVSPVGGNLIKLNTGAQLRTFPYPMASKSFLSSNAFMAKSGAQTLTFKSVTNRQTNKQTKNSLAAPAASEIRAQPNLAW